MIKVAKVLGWTFLVLILLLAVGVTFTIGWRPFIGPRARPLTNFKFQSTPERLARGRYLVEDVTACMVCHAPHDWQPLSAPVPQPDLSTPLKRGDYLVTIASCADCHTPQDGHGQPLPGMDYGGGLLFEGPWGRVVSANITPDPSGIPYYDLELFTQALRTGYVKARPLNQIMSWGAYCGMTDEDIAAVFAKIKTLKPVVHQVDNTEPPTYCKLDKLMHGGGNQN